MARIPIMASTSANHIALRRLAAEFFGQTWKFFGQIGFVGQSRSDRRDEFVTKDELSDGAN